jgi:hypothetical protein
VQCHSVDRIESEAKASAAGHAAAESWQCAPERALARRTVPAASMAVVCPEARVGSPQLRMIEVVLPGEPQRVEGFNRRVSRHTQTAVREKARFHGSYHFSP